ncbi:MAG TPA: FtsW/RodA/SpoVE family cell cycle protein [Longimicrobiaceae bacterium]|nr:FtsW/RodA/SpoVE family cell cycle protein [Longimicrobiaceae bacterium]
MLLAGAFYVLAHLTIVEGIWPVHGTAPGAGSLLIRDGVALTAWLLVLPALRMLGYRGSWGIVALPIIIFLLTRPSLFQLFSDPVYQARGASRVEANALKAERARITTILRTYDEDRLAIVFPDSIPVAPDPLDAVRSEEAPRRGSLAILVSASTVLLAPLAMVFGFAVTRRPRTLRWFRDNRRLPFAATMSIFFILTLFFVELGRVGGTTPWELFLPLFIGTWAAVLGDDAYNLARPGAVLAPRRILLLLLYGALPVVPFLIIRELGLSVVLAGSLATMLLVGTRREWWAALMLGVWVVLVIAAFNLDPRSQNRLQLAINPYRDLTEMTTAEAESWAGRMHQFKLFDANVLAGGLFGDGAGRGHPETAPNAADDGYITTIAANWGLIGTLALVLLYTALVIEMLTVAARERGAFERSLVTGLAMLLAIPFWMAALGGVRAVPLTGVATAFAANGGAKLLASALAVGIVAAVSHRRAEADRLEAAADSLHGPSGEQGIRIR